MEQTKECKCLYEGCRSSFKNNYNLKRHIKTKHLGQRNFECKYCGLKLVSKQNLKEHKYIHLGIKPFKCSFPGCNKKYRQSSQLSIHKKTHHANSKATGKKNPSLITNKNIPEQKIVFLMEFDLPVIDQRRSEKQLSQQLPNFTNI